MQSGYRRSAPARLETECLPDHGRLGRPRGAAVHGRTPLVLAARPRDQPRPPEPTTQLHILEPVWKTLVEPSRRRHVKASAAQRIDAPVRGRHIRALHHATPARHAQSAGFDRMRSPQDRTAEAPTPRQSVKAIVGGQGIVVQKDGAGRTNRGQARVGGAGEPGTAAQAKLRNVQIETLVRVVHHEDRPTRQRREEDLQRSERAPVGDDDRKRSGHPSRSSRARLSVSLSSRTLYGFWRKPRRPMRPPKRRESTWA